jgi:hypothetical protein
MPSKDFCGGRCRRFEGGYRVYRARRDGDAWRVLLVADARGLPAGPHRG